MARPPSANLVGREEELSCLMERLAAAGRGEPSLTLVSGEPGVGKTRLVAEVARGAREQGMLVLAGDCLQLSGGEFPYAPLVGALRGTEDGAALEEALGRLPTGGRAEIARLVPELAGDAEPAPAEELPSAFSQGRLFELLLSLLRRLADRAPLLFVVDDAHWSDTSTRDFITYLAHNLIAERIAAVVAHRTLRRRDPFAAVVAELTRRAEVTRLELGRLGRGEIERLVDGRVGAVAGQVLVDEVFARSGGIPFYAEEVLAARLGGEDGALLARHDALLTRLDALPGEARPLLGVLAVLGRAADETLLAEVLGEPEAALSDALRAAVDEHLLERDAHDRFDFCHALMREAVLGDLMPGERRRLHRSLAEALVRREGANPAELAYHWGGAKEPAAELAARVDAGLDAERLYAFADAREHFHRAVELLAPGREAGAPGGLDRVDLLRHEAECARLAGDCDAAAALCRTALGELDPVREPLRAAMVLERYGAHLFWGDEDALAAYSEALEVLPPGHDRERARILSATALALHDRCRWEEAREHAEQALELATAAGSAPEEAHAHLTLGTALAFLGDPRAGEDHVRRAGRIAREHGSAEDRARVQSHLAEVLRMQGRVAAALEVMREGAEESARLGMTGSFGNSMRVNGAEDLLWLGRWEEADEVLRETARLDLRDAAHLLHRTVNGQLAVARGDRVAARRHLEAATAACGDETAADYAGAVVAGWAELALWEGRPRDALEAVGSALDGMAGPGHPLYTPVLYTLDCRAAADVSLVPAARREAPEDRPPLERAEAWVAALEALIARHRREVTPPQAAATLALCRAELARGAGRPAPEAWQEAAGWWAAFEQPYPEAYARWRQAQALLEGDGARPAAAEALGTARAIAERLRAAPLLAEIDALARAARLVLPGRPTTPPAPAAVLSQLELTARELDVLELLAEGATDREIADRLFISVRTAGVHVSRILRKLNVRRRAHAVSTARQLGILDALSARH
jgi:DNA-binding CsgD family transcriptional regulator/tetratricopeptide (TPR) repeat protein